MVMGHNHTRRESQSIICQTLIKKGEKKKTYTYMIVNGYSESSSRSSELYPIAEDGSKEASQSKKQLPGKQKFPQYTRHGAGGGERHFRQSTYTRL